VQSSGGQCTAQTSDSVCYCCRQVQCLQSRHVGMLQPSDRSIVLQASDFILAACRSCFNPLECKGNYSANRIIWSWYVAVDGWAVSLLRLVQRARPTRPLRRCTDDCPFQLLAVDFYRSYYAVTHYHWNTLAGYSWRSHTIWKICLVSIITYRNAPYRTAIPPARRRHLRQIQHGN